MPGQIQRHVSSIASHRVLLYSIFSIGAVIGVIIRALKKHSNFYSVAVYISKSNGTVMVMANFGVLLALLAGKFVQIVFFGPLRPMEVERLYDRMWFFVTESLLAFTIFRDEFDIPFALMFGILLFTKCFHWLLSDRIEWMDQRPYPGPPLLFHIRTHALISLLGFTDAVAFLLTIENMLSNGVGGTVLFASEYAILLASLGNSVAKYCLALAELRRASLRGGENAPPWEDKSMLVFYVELATDFLKLVTYLTFFILVLTFYGLPLNIVRDVYITARSFIMRFRDLLRYRTATRNMDQRYPNATEEELNNLSDRTCIICRDEMAHPTTTASEAQQANEQHTPQDGPNTTPKKLPCGHIFHFHCLRSWLERQQSCPTCRRSVLENERPVDRNGGAARPRPIPRPQVGFRIQIENQNNLAGGENPVHMPDGGGLFWEAPRPQLQEIQRRPLRHERFPGFFTPDGVWHPWPQGVHNAVENAAQHVAEPTRTVNPGNADALADNRSNNSLDGPTMNEHPRNIPTTSDRAVSAQEAAAAAALRRLTPSTSARQAETQSRPTLTNEALNPIQSRHSSQETTIANDTLSGSVNGSSPLHMRAPALIPMTDPYTRIPSRHDTIRPGQRQPPSPDSINSSYANRALRDLPPSLTDEQLQVLDQVTRDAIDERLRILEGIQETTSRCVVELLRCRSALPRSTLPPIPLASRENDTSTASFIPGGASASEPNEQGYSPSGSGSQAQPTEVQT